MSLSVGHIPSLLLSQGMTQPFSPSIDGRYNVCIQLDGRIIGWASPKLCQQFAKDLRIWKTESVNNVPLDLEIGYVPEMKGGQYPGLYLFSSKARMMRPVKYLENGRNDSIGSFEQVYMDIAVKPEEVQPGLSTHVEHSATNFLSILANMTPFSDFNQVCSLWNRSRALFNVFCFQSPRNIYQCQVSKSGLILKPTEYTIIDG